MSIITSIFAKLQYFLPHYFLSKLVYSLANSDNNYLKNKLISWFIKKFKVDLSLAQRKEVTDYKNFNDFFTRHLDLDPNKRIINHQAKILSPADGQIAAIGAIKNNSLYQAKGKYFSLLSLMGEGEPNNSHNNSDKFFNGSYFTIYLAPKDYHRVHMPHSGKLEQMIYIPGRLFSVNNASCNNIHNIFARNERIINIFKTDEGYMAIVMVGALLVGSMATSWHGIITPPHGLNHNQRISHWDYTKNNIQLNKSDELGYFQMGSTVIVIFSKNHDFDPKLLGTDILYGQSIPVAL